MDKRSILMGIAFALMWSSAFTSAKIIVLQASPLASLSIRFFMSGIIGILIAKAMGQSFHLTRHQWKATIIFGLCQNALYLGLNFVAMQTVQASLASIIASSMPLMVAFVGWVLFRDRLTYLAALGLITGFVGVILITGLRLDKGADPYGIVLCVVGALALSVATLSVRGASHGGNVMMVVGLQMIVGSIVLGIASYVTETPYVSMTPSFVMAFIYTTLVPGLIATIVWFKLVNRIGALKAATYHFLNPFFGVAIAALFLGEAMSMLDFVGVGIITAGILAVQLSKSST